MFYLFLGGFGLFLCTVENEVIQIVLNQSY